MSQRTKQEHHLLIFSPRRISENKAVSKAVELGQSDTLKIALTVQEGRSGKRAHQTYLSISDPTTGLETSFPFSVKESGKAKLELVGTLPG